MDNLNLKAFRAIQAEHARGEDAHLVPHYPQRLPKTIWIYWGQGEDNAPHIVKRSIESWRNRNPRWDVKVLDEKSVAQFVDMSDCPAFLGHRLFSDLLRLRLLEVHGGVWADATVFCHRPLDDWLALQATAGFFCFVEPGPDRLVETWFIAAQKGNFLAAGWARALSDAYRPLAEPPDIYFLTMYAFQWWLKTNADAGEAWRRCAKLPAQPTFFLMSHLHGRTPFEVVSDAIEVGLPVSKLDWRADVEPEAFDQTIARL